MRFLCASLAIAALTVPALAQVIVIPNGMAAAEGSTLNLFPWGRGGTGMRIQTIYDSSHFTAQGITTPVMITRLRWRPNTATAVVASSYGTGATVSLSTCPVDQGVSTAAFASNQGNDYMVCYSGPVSWPAAPAVTGPCPFVIDIPLTNGFLYDPNAGDLNIETDLPIQTFTGTTFSLDVHGAAPLASRVYLSTGYANGAPNATAIGVDRNHGVVVEVTCAPVSGLQARFGATPRDGGTPLLVQFTSTSYSSDPGGILTYAWDFNGDSVVDSTLPNPSFTYTTCGTYTPSLTVTDATHGPSTLTRPNLIITDMVTPTFSFTALGNNTFQFTDTTVPAATSWAWDFDGDNITDSTAQNPVRVYPAGCTKPLAKLTVNRLCRGPFSTPATGSPGSAVCSTMTGGNGNTSTTAIGNMFDLVVNSAQGISVCAVTITPYNFTGAFTCDVYVTPGTYVGNNLNAAVWRKIGTGVGVSAGGTVTTNPVRNLVTLAQPFYLPPGNYGMAVYISTNPAATVNLAYSNAPIGPFSNGDVTFAPSPATAPGIAQLALFSGSTTPGRLWNGILHYSTVAASGEAGYGFFGPGCAGTLGIPGNTASALPRLGQTMTANLSGLQSNAAFFVLGFSRTSSIFGPLPFNLASLGAPGCFGRVSTDSVLLIAGAGNTAAFNLSVPNNPIYLGNMLFTQGLAIDTVNALGGVTSDAAAFIVGL